MQRRRSFQFAFLLFSLAMFCAAVAIASPAQTLTTLVSFDGTNGAGPQSSLIQGSDGNFYGTTTYGGANNVLACDFGNLVGCGTVFKITPGGTLTTLYSFCAQSDCTDGASPYGGLVQGTDGNFYGTTYFGGALANCGGLYGCGTVFKITPGGTLTTLYSFCSQTNCVDGAYTYAGLVPATDGNFYGTTWGGGASSYYCPIGCGTVFKITPAGTLTTLHSFDGNDGGEPQAGVVQAADGNFYGTTASAATPSTVFRITTGGILTTLYHFCSQPNCADGSDAHSALVQATDGNFYGTTVSGGTAYSGDNIWGTVFRITPGGTLTTLYNFCSQIGCIDGVWPYDGLVQGTDGNLYGTTSGPPSTVFKITLMGTLSTLHTFDGADGATPYAGLVQATDGNFYGTTTYGGANQIGTVFSLSVGLGPFIKTQPTSGKTGYPVVILGTNLTGATGVTFNGTAATFNVVSPSEITTNVPAGATTGLVQVTRTPSGTLTSNATFVVTTPVQFVAVTPCRLLDTRGGGAIQGGTFQTFNLPQLAQKQGCTNLSTAAAYSLNVTAVPQGPLGYLTIWPAGEIMPYASTMNSYDGRVKANAAIVPAGSNAVSVFVTNTSDVILDIDGYFTTSSQQTLQFYPLPPCRVADTRDGTDFASGLGPPYLMAQMERDFPVLNAANNKVPCNIPSNAQAYSMNFTAVPHGFLGYLTVWPTGENQPTVSTLNAYGGQVTANAAIVPAGTNGSISTYALDDTDLLIDINGYFAPPGQGGLSLYPVAPCRVLDTRPHPFQFELMPPVDVINSPCGVPNMAEAYVFNATVVPQGGLGYLTLWPDGSSQPVVSTLNAYDGAVSSNMAIVPAGNQGKVDAYVDPLNPSDPKDVTDLILDISSYFAP
jgi:uncharacterized repeat protein (TIGR03803 family)